MSNIQDLLKQITKDTEMELYSKECKVVSVNESLAVCECEPIDGSANIIDVKLQTAVASGVLIVPVVNSFLTVSFINPNAAFVSQYSIVDKVVFMDGNNDGMVLINPLVQKINNLESDLNQLKSIFAAWVPVINDGGAALKGLTAGWSSSSLPITLRQDIENTKITQ
jgi:hypothetical protein